MYSHITLFPISDFHGITGKTLHQLHRIFHSHRLFEQRCTPKLIIYVRLLPGGGLSHQALRLAIPAKVDDIIAEGLRHQVDDLVVLPFDHSPGTAGALPWPAYDPEALQRPHLGGNVTFSCVLPPGTPSNAVSWLHQDRVVFERGQPVPEQDGQEYSFSHVDTLMLFRISHISFLSSGSVACVNTVDSLPIKRYTLLPRVTRATQVFQTPMPDQRVTEGDTLIISCALRLPLSPQVIKNDLLQNHVMFRHNGRLLYWPDEAPYGLLRPHGPLVDGKKNGALEVNRAIRSPFVVQADVPNISAVSGTGTAECWFRPHAGLHEWIVQKAMVVVLSRKA
ncbi:uncharacterized protein LOC129595013 [Paramacrobiotus metropolitanus]|uniref:uncharacterized protein LOC129595013 n=1 Tax=Paramacrobiotus metropolitanus TaxID=2943436 RepID=UPI002446102D|nr:uncharacterized protein LOC129595013 [Paramacrobiotus metropolitanus]